MSVSISVRMRRQAGWGHLFFFSSSDWPDRSLPCQFSFPRWFPGKFEQRKREQKKKKSSIGKELNYIQPIKSCRPRTNIQYPPPTNPPKRSNVLALAPLLLLYGVKRKGFGPRATPWPRKIDSDARSAARTSWLSSVL
jgi:hypothetical protein